MLTNQRELLFISPPTCFIYVAQSLSQNQKGMQTRQIEGAWTEKHVQKEVEMFFSCFGGGENARAVEERFSDRLQCKVVVVGDGECGKTCLLQRFCHDTFSSQGYLPTVFDTQVVDMVCGPTTIELTLMDTAGQEDYDRLRPFAYTDTDVVLICFSVDNPDSLENVLLTWVPEVRYFCGDAVPLMLVGNKTDVRFESEGSGQDITDSGRDWSNISFIKQGPVKTARARSVAADIGAVGYWETSALTDEGVSQVFQAVCKLALMQRHRKRGRRSVRRKKSSLLERISGRHA